MQCPSVTHLRSVFPFAGPLYETVRKRCATELSLAICVEGNWLNHPVFIHKLSKTARLVTIAKDLLKHVAFERRLNCLIWEGEDEITDLQTRECIEISIARQREEEKVADELADQLEELAQRKLCI